MVLKILATSHPKKVKIDLQNLQKTCVPFLQECCARGQTENLQNDEKFD